MVSEVLFIIGVFFVAAGDPAPAVNEQHYLARLKHYWDPQWCAGDLFLESPDAHLTIVLLAGWTTKFLSLPAVAWAGRLLAWGLIGWALQRLSWAVTPRPWCSVLVAALWVVGAEQGHLAGEWVIGGVEAKCFAYAFVLLGLTAYLEDRWRAVWVHLGCATALHALVGGWSVLIMAALAVGSKTRPSWRSMAPWLAAGGLIGLAGVAPPIVMNWSTPPEVVAEANRIYVFDRLPHHLAPLSKPPEWIAERAGRHAAMLALLVAATLSARENPRLRRLCLYAWGAVGLLAVGLTIEAVAPSREAVAGLLRFYWLRLSDVAAPLAVAAAVTDALAQGIAQRRPLALAGLAGVLVIAAAHFGPEVRGRSLVPLPPADARLPNYADWVDACDWARENTPPDAIFLVPRGANSFKWRAERAEVATWKDIPQDAASMVEWRRRVYNLAHHSEVDGHRRRARSLGALGSIRLRELAEEYDARFVLTPSRNPVSLPVAYRNATYTIYAIPPRAAPP